MKEIHEFISKIKVNKEKIAIIGDLMLDEYYYVNADRVSPEFPIAILLSNQKTPCLALPGGAGNVLSQFRHFNVDAKLFSLNGVDVPIKKRFYHGEFPLCRWDIEKPNYGLSDKELELKTKELFELYSSSKFKPKVVIFSDYNKGTFNGDQSWQSILEESISIVDPKKGPLSKWYGCTVFKPNSKEAYELSGQKDWRKQCKFFMEELRCKSVIITQGGEGVVGIDYDKNEFEYRPVHNIVADSVIGAGDCFVSFLAMALACDISILDAAKIAFEAGAVYVQRRHNTPVTPYELLKHVDPIAAKFVDPTDLANRDYKLVFTNGCFDMLHTGHVYSLIEAKKLGDKLVVAVNSDNSIKKLKGEERPIVGIQDRMNMLASLEAVDFVVEFNEETPYNLIKLIRPDIIAKGKAEGYVVGSDISHVVIVGELSGKSTTNLIERIRNVKFLD